MDVQVGGIFGLTVLVADIWAILNTAGSSSSTGKKVAWIVAILLLPVIGFIAWLVFGPRTARSIT